MQAVHIPLPIRQHRRWLSGLPRPAVAGPWHERLVRSPWTYVLIAATALYIGCLRGIYWNNFGRPRSTGSGDGPSASVIGWYHASYVGFAVALVVLVGVGVAILRQLRGRRRTVALGIDLAALAAVSALGFASLVAGARVGWLPIMTGLHGYGPYALYQLFLGWGALTAAAAFALYLCLHGEWRQRRWLRYLLAALIVVAYVALFTLLLQAMTSRLAIQVGDIAADDLWRQIQKYALYAFYTLSFWLVLFLAVDRWRPQRFIMWYLALGWGACVSTYLSMFLNTWVNQMMANATDGPGVDAGSAIFSAPFVEEASKATILFLLAAALRYRLTTRSSIFTLAGLSAAGFAFTENILYYIRAHLMAVTQISTGDAEKYVLELVKLRGMYTAFGHELFTSMTAIGLITAVSARSKSVRILAPLAGFCGAALGHMSFNGSASLIQASEGKTKAGYLAIGIIVVVVMIGVSVLNAFLDGRRIRARLTDYVRMGWLRPTDPRDYGRLTSRASLLWHALWSAVRRGRPSRFFATVSMIRTFTELAFLRDGITRGLIDDAGLEREKELLLKIRDLRERAIAPSHAPVVGAGVAPAAAVPGYAPGPGPAFLPPAPGYASAPAIGGYAPPQAGVGGYPGQDRPWGPRF